MSPGSSGDDGAEQVTGSSRGKEPGTENSIQVHLFIPFSNKAGGEEVIIPADQPLSPSELMLRLAALNRQVAVRLGITGERGQAAVLVVNGRLIGRGDLIHPGDSVSLVAAVAEG